MKRDSELKILESLATDLGAKAGDVGANGQVLKIYDNVYGKLEIASELSVCQSCDGVLRQFQEMFPNVNVVIGSTNKIKMKDNLNEFYKD